MGFGQVLEASANTGDPGHLVSGNEVVSPATQNMTLVPGPGMSPDSYEGSVQITNLGPLDTQFILRLVVQLVCSSGTPTGNLQAAVTDGAVIAPDEPVDHTGTINVGNQTINLKVQGFPPPAHKTGVKFNDVNGNGTQDGGELGLSGVQIRAYADNNAANGSLDAAEFAAGPVATDTTVGTGAYDLTLPPGAYIVCEVLPIGSTQTFPANTICNLGPLGPGGHAVTLTAGQTDSGNNFGNQGLAQKTGVKFNDLNGNGTQDGGELGLSGVQIRAYADNNAANGSLDAAEFGVSPVATDTTNGTGAYSLTLAPGAYIICEVLPTGSTQTFPANTICNLGPLGPGGHAVTLTAGQTDANNNFGNRGQAQKTGVKFNDVNGNGTQDGGELGLSGVQIRAYADNNAANGSLDAAEFAVSPVATDTTTATGAYNLTLAPGAYIVCEVAPAGTTQTFPANTICNAGAPLLGPGGHAVTLAAGQVDSGNDFGNQDLAQKTGIKFNDLNGNGTQDQGELGLSGVEIRAYANNNPLNGVLDAAEFAAVPVATDTTNGSGAYSLTLAPGAYIICEVATAGSTQTFPANTICNAGVPTLGPGGHAVTLTAGQVDSGNNFANMERPGSITIRKVVPTDYRRFSFRFLFEGQAEPFQLGDGQQIVFDNLVAGNYIIREIDPDGFHLADIDCTPEATFIDINIDLLQVEIDLPPGEDVVCTFRNEKDGGQTLNAPLVDNTNEAAGTAQGGLGLAPDGQLGVLGDAVQAPSDGQLALADPGTGVQGMDQLPRTGSSLGVLALFGAMLMGLGSLVALAARRRPQTAGK